MFSAKKWTANILRKSDSKTAPAAGKETERKDAGEEADVRAREPGIPATDTGDNATGEQVVLSEKVARGRNTVAVKTKPKIVRTGLTNSASRAKILPAKNLPSKKTSFAPAVQRKVNHPFPLGSVAKRTTSVSTSRVAARSNVSARGACKGGMSASKQTKSGEGIVTTKVCKPSRAAIVKPIVTPVPIADRYKSVFISPDIYGTMSWSFDESGGESASGGLTPTPLRARTFDLRVNKPDVNYHENDPRFQRITANMSAETHDTDGADGNIGEASSFPTGGHDSSSQSPNANNENASTVKSNNAETLSKESETSRLPNACDFRQAVLIEETESSPIVVPCCRIVPELIAGCPVNESLVVDMKLIELETKASQSEEEIAQLELKRASEDPDLPAEELENVSREYERARQKCTRTIEWANAMFEQAEIIKQAHQLELRFTTDKERLARERRRAQKFEPSLPKVLPKVSFALNDEIKSPSGNIRHRPSKLAPLECSSDRDFNTSIIHDVTIPPPIFTPDANSTSALHQSSIHNASSATPLSDHQLHPNYAPSFHPRPSYPVMSSSSQNSHPYSPLNFPSPSRSRQQFSNPRYDVGKFTAGGSGDPNDPHNGGNDRRDRSDPNDFSSRDSFFPHHRGNMSGRSGNGNGGDRGDEDSFRRRSNASFAYRMQAESDAFYQRNRSARVNIGSGSSSVQDYRTPELWKDIEKCPPWRVGGAQSDSRSIVDFLDQFWSKLGMFIADPAQCLARFAMILDASEETQFMVEPINEYIVRQRQNEQPCRFAFAEDSLRRAFWNHSHQMAIATAFDKASYDSKICNMIKFATFWYRRLRQIGMYAPSNPLIAVYDKLPYAFRAWAKSQYGIEHPESLQECCEWAARYDAMFHTERALGSSTNIAAPVTFVMPAKPVVKPNPTGSTQSPKSTNSAKTPSDPVRRVFRRTLVVPKNPDSGNAGNHSNAKSEMKKVSAVEVANLVAASKQSNSTGDNAVTPTDAKARPKIANPKLKKWEAHDVEILEELIEEIVIETEASDVVGSINQQDAEFEEAV